MRQRKINDDVLLQLLRGGKSRKEAAAHFGVSAVAIHKRLKRILPRPESLDKLTDKEQKFVISIVEGKSRTQAAMDSFDVSSRGSAKTIQNELMQKDDIKIAIADLMSIYGLTRGYRINKLKTHVDHVDPNISLKGLDMSFKLDGLYAPEKHLTLNFDYAALSKRQEERQKEIDRLRSELGEYEEYTNPHIAGR